MTHTTARVAAALLSAAMTLCLVAGINAIAARQYAAADALALAARSPAVVAVQHTPAPGRHANA